MINLTTDEVLPGDVCVSMRTDLNCLEGKLSPVGDHTGDSAELVCVSCALSCILRSLLTWEGVMFSQPDGHTPLNKII